MDDAENHRITITEPSEKRKRSLLNITISIPFHDEDKLSKTLRQLKTKVLNVERKEKDNYLSNSVPQAKQEKVDKGGKEHSNQINHQGHNIETRITHKDENDFPKIKEVGSYISFVNKLNVSSKETVCKSKNCSEILLPITDKIKRKKSKFCKRERSQLNMSFLHSFNKMNEAFIDRENGKNQIENENAMNFKFEKKETENSLYRISNQRMLLGNTKEVSFNKEEVLDKKNNKMLQNKIRKQNCAGKFGNNNHSKMENFNHDRIVSDLGSKTRSLCQSRFNGDQNKSVNKIICDVTYSADVPGNDKYAILEKDNQAKHLQVSDAGQNGKPSESVNIALKKSETDKNYLINNNSNIDEHIPSEDIRSIEETHNKLDKIAFHKPAKQQEPFSVNFEDATGSRTPNNITKTSETNGKISEREVPKTAHQEDNMLTYNTEKKAREISSDKAFCNKKNYLKNICNQNYVEILRTNMQNSENENTFTSKDKDLSKKKKKDTAIYDIRKFATIQQDTKTEENALEDVAVKNKKNTENCELCKSQQFIDEEALIPLEKEDNIEVPCQSSKENMLDNLSKNAVNDAKEEIMDNKHNGTKKSKHDVAAEDATERELVVTKIKKKNMEDSNSIKQPLSYMAGNNSCNEKRKLKDLYKQASTHCKRLKMEDELLDPELVSINTLRENMFNQPSEKPLKNMQHNPTTTNTSNLNIVKNVQNNIGSSNNILKNEINSTSAKLERIKKMKENDSTSKDLLQMPAVEKNYKSSLMTSTIPNSAEKINSSLKSKIQIAKKGKATEVNSEGVNCLKQTTNKQARDKDTKALLQDEDSSDEEEKDFGNIMNYLKDYAYNKVILNTSNGHKLKACVRNKERTLSRKNIFDIYSSDDLSSDSSVSEYAIQLTNQNIKKKNTLRRKSSNSKIEKNNILLNFLNQPKTMKDKHISKDVKLNKVDLLLTGNKLSSKDKLSNLDSSESSGKDSSVNVSKMVENENCKNIHRNYRGKQQINKKNIDIGNSLHNETPKGKPLAVCSNDFDVPSTKINTSQLDEDCILSIRESNENKEQYIATSVKEDKHNLDDSKKKKIGSLPLENSSPSLNQNGNVNGTDNTAFEENNPISKKKYKYVQKQNIDSSTEEDSESNPTGATTLNNIVYKENKTKKLKQCMVKQYSKCKAKTDEGNKLKHNKTQKQPKKMILEYIDEALVERYDTVPKPIKRAEESACNSDHSYSGIKDGISNFETDKESDEECKAKLLEIISYADNEILNILEENEQLKDLKINISWDVPISHKIESRISSCPTKEQQQVFKDLDIKMKLGPFTMVEDEIIKKNFKQFCMEHGLKHDPAPFLCLQYGQVPIFKKRQRIKFGRYLGRGLENRKLHCIYSRFKVLYSTFKKGRFTPEEDAVIMEFTKVINDKGKQFSALSKILNRPRSLIEKRFRILERQNQLLKPHDYPRLVKSLIEVTNSDNLEELRDKRISDEEWHKAANKLRLCKTHLKVCWTASLYTKLFHKGPIDVDKIMRKFIANLDKREEDDYRKLNWRKLAKPFKYVTHGFLYRLFKKTKNRIVPLELHSNLRKCVLRLKRAYEENEKIMPPINNIILKL